MFVTFDSNVFNIANRVATKLPTPGVRWCTHLDRCEDVSNDPNTSWLKPSVNSKKLQFFYNTPISMATDVTVYNLPKNSMHFVYLDFGENSTALARILKNIKQLNNVIIISNGDVYSTGQYTLHVGNCSDENIAEVIGGIIIVHLAERRTVHQKELISLLCDSDSIYKPTIHEQNQQKEYSIYNIMDSKRSNYGEIPDCFECKT